MAVAYFLLNAVASDPALVTATRSLAVESLRAALWGVDQQEPHADALGIRDLALVYLGAPDRVFIGRAEIASTVHPWTPLEASRYPGDTATGVLLTQVDAWDPPLPMADVLTEIGPSDTTKADFPYGVMRIVESEYRAALAVAARR